MMIIFPFVIHNEKIGGFQIMLLLLIFRCVVVAVVIAVFQAQCNVSVSLCDFLYFALALKVDALSRCT